MELRARSSLGTHITTAVATCCHVVHAVRDCKRVILNRNSSTLSINLFSPQTFADSVSSQQPLREAVDVTVPVPCWSYSPSDTSFSI